MPDYSNLANEYEAFAESTGEATHAKGQHESHREGRVARSIENQTAKLPSDLLLWAAGGSIALSLFFQGTDQRQRALFVGQWAPTFLLLGIYNKLVKQQGND